MVPVFLVRMLKPALPYLAGAAAVFGVILYVLTLRHDLTASRDKNIALAADNQANVAAIAAYQAQAVKWSAAMAVLDTRSVGRNTSVTRITDRIGAAPKGDDGPVAPVLAQAMDGLRALQGSAP